MTQKLQPLSKTLIGTWELLSREDVTASGESRIESSLGADPFGLLIYDSGGNFAAQFMKRVRVDLQVDNLPASVNNSRAQGGYDAYFGTYTVDDQKGTVTQKLVAALSPENVGQVLTRSMTVTGDRLEIKIDIVLGDGMSIVRTLRWRRVA